MRTPRNQSGVIRLSDALKALGPAASYVFLLTLSLVVLVIGRIEPAVIDRARGLIIDALSPVLDILSRPVDAVRTGADIVDSHFNLQSENERLKQEVDRLKAWQAAARNLADENKGLRALMALPADPQTTYVTARVVADAGGPFVRTLLVTVGEKDGIQRGQAIATGDGVVGRIVGIGARASRVLLLTDLNSRVPVMVQGTKLRAILTGDNSPHPKLEFLPSAASVNPGDRIVTSGDGGMFPAGLPIGTVVALDGRTPRVQLLVDLQKLDFVRVLKFSVPLSIDDRGPEVIAPPGPAPQPAPAQPAPVKPQALKVQQPAIAADPPPAPITAATTDENEDPTDRPE